MPQPHTLILTNPSDPHSFVVREALRLKGVDASLWHTTDFPSIQQGSVFLDSVTDDWEIVGPELDLNNPKLSSVWIRRPEQPILTDSLSPADMKFAMRECSTFLRSLNYRIAENAFWINPLPSRARANLKLEQLRAASRLGFGIPRTLCSNDPARVRHFITSNPTGTIYKSLWPASWKTSNGVAALFSSVVTLDDLPPDDILINTPGIFQELIPKSFELRITVIGHHLVSVKLKSQEIPEARIDWRRVPDVPIEPFDLCDSVAAACHQMMNGLGIVFGCFDVIVTPSNDYIFLEVNEAGAFLWIEEQLPEIGLLDAFCEFIKQGRTDFTWTQSRRRVTLADVAAEAEYQREEVASRIHRSGAGSSMPDSI